MKKIAKLVQSPEVKAVIVDLEDDEIAILTGVMGGCCSIIVLWGGLNENGYKKVRGHHAGGGPGNLNWGLLLKGVPNNENTKIVMSCAPCDYTGEYSYTGKVKDALKDLEFKCKRSFCNFSNALIDRHGTAFPFDEMAKGANYEIRNKNARFII
jgi:hypothetical protein